MTDYPIDAEGAYNKTSALIWYEASIVDCETVMFQYNSIPTIHMEKLLWVAYKW